MKNKTTFWDYVAVVAVGVLIGTMFSLGLLGMTLAQYVAQFFN